MDPPVFEMALGDRNHVDQQRIVDVGNFGAQVKIRALERHLQFLYVKTGFLCHPIEFCANFTQRHGDMTRLYRFSHE